MGQNAVVKAGRASVVAAARPPTLIMMSSLAQDWFNDARWEAENPLAKDNYHYRRREVLFAVCFAETYLFEWTLAVLGWDGDRLTRYFPKGDRRGVAEKWIQVPAALLRDKVLRKPLQLSAKHNVSWQALLSARNGLAHSLSSWPEVLGRRPNHPRPRPLLLDLGRRAPGWALSVAAERVKRLHAAAGFPVPAWMSNPVPFKGCLSCQRP